MFASQTTILAAMGLLLTGTSVMGIFQESGEKQAIMRTEKASMVLQASGTVKTRANHAEALETQPAAKSAGSNMFDELLRASDNVMCNDDFPVGPDPCKCADNEQLAPETPILQMEMCKTAAEQARVRKEAIVAPEEKFSMENEEMEHSHPKGCFKQICDENQESDFEEDPVTKKRYCYFYNAVNPEPVKCQNEKSGNQDTLPDGTIPEVTGKPVCVRKKLHSGTIGGNGGCPKGYGVLMTEDECRGASICLGYCDAEEFLVAQTNATEYNDYPLGCFLATKEGSDQQCVHFNKLPAGTTNPTADEWVALDTIGSTGLKFPSESTLKGTPICAVGGTTEIRAPAGHAAAGGT
jgi:hypothetical protein